MSDAGEEARDFETLGYGIVPGVLTAPECDAICGQLDQSAGGPGTRSILDHPWCAESTVLENKVAVRIHLDDCDPEDGTLRVVPGSHRDGHGEQKSDIDCSARRGDALVMRPLLLHSSTKATGISLRRVLHFVFGLPELPYGLRWDREV